MRKSLEYKILVSVLTLCVFSTAGTALAANTGISSNVESIDGGGWCYVGSNGYSGNKVDIDTSISSTGIVGGFDKGKTNGATDNIVNINGTETATTVVDGRVYGGYSANGKVSINIINISNSEITNPVYGGFSKDGSVIQNYVTINNSKITRTVYGGNSSNSVASNNHVTINGGIINAVEGGHNGSKGTANNNYVTINGGTITGNNGESVFGGYAAYGDEANSNEVKITGGIINCDISGGYAKTDANYNKINISGGVINESPDGEEGIYGGQARSSANNNEISISGGTINVEVYGGYSNSNGETNNNTINISGNAKLDNAKLFGSNKTYGTGNILTINGWYGSTQSVQNFNKIKFENVKWQNDGTVLNITANDKSDALKNTIINHENMIISGGNNLSTGDRMTLIKGQNLGITDSNVAVDGTFTAGVTVAGTGEAQVADDGNSVSYTVTSVKMLDQIDLVAENRAVAAAFVNQGTDLINDSLDVLSRDGKYGIKTFAAVHGNRSKYDVNSDLKINGWSSIVGVGNEKNIGNGDFSWGVFYENGSGNYRTYNEFNNEFFRGDGSLVYNGGGIAARFEQDNGVYTEGSLRAGMLKSEMTNALKDGAGNSYGYKSESTYYGAHIGVGKIISLNEATDLDVYGKFFHTYTDGDSFTVANDKFEFDSITSDRLRIGARLTTNKEKNFSTYYGFAYEYEFNGDADMRAQNMSAPEQSLKGSSCMAEIGMNYKPSSESPWSFDLSMRGYAGQREGFSGNVQATYSF